MANLVKGRSEGNKMQGTECNLREMTPSADPSIQGFGNRAATASRFWKFAIDSMDYVVSHARTERLQQQGKGKNT